MDNYDKQITSEVTKSPKNKKKIVRISVIAAVVVLLILLSSLIPALILNAKIEKLVDETSEMRCIEFRRNSDNKSYRASLSENYIFPEVIEIPSIYDNSPVTKFLAGETSAKAITLAEGITQCIFWNTKDIVTVYLPKTIVSLGSKSSEVDDYSYFYTCPNLKTIYLYKETIIYPDGIRYCENVELIYYE